MSRFPDPILAGLERGWKVIDAGSAGVPRDIECDVAIVGTGAGGGVTAEILARAGLDVVLVEEGPLRSSSDFRMREAEAYPQLYQEAGARKTLDKGVTILQGRCVGGSTTVNWTSSFRTPRGTLDFWREHFDLPDYESSALAAWFAQAERRLSIGPWLGAPNRNNDLLRLGAERLGLHVAAIPRNVRGCFDLGYCGMGCPTNAKQSMLLTTVPAALDHGARLLTRARATRLILEGGSGGHRAAALEIDWLDASGQRPDGTRTTVRARHYVLAGGAINTPAILLRSGGPDPYSLTGTRSFLHPTVVSAAVHADRVGGDAGAPQTFYSDHFLGTQAIDGPLGYKIEAPPLHPLLFASTTQGFGGEHAARMREFPNTHVLIALLRDGFSPRSPGGKVVLRDDGSAVLDYRLDDFFFEGARRALLSMAEIQLAAGAREVLPVHEQATSCTTLAQARAAIAALPMQPLLTRVVSAHVMGGCAMSGDERRGVVRPDGVHHQIANVSVHDGSLFPTSIGANPQLSIYGIVARLATRLSERLTGKPSTGLA